MEQLFASFRLALRRIRRGPRTAFFSVLILACAMVLVLPTHGLLQGIYLRGLPVEHGKRIVALSTGKSPLWPSRPDVFQQLAGNLESVEELAALRSFNTSVTPDSGVTTVIHGSYVTHNLFRTLGVEPALGRDFTVNDEEPSQPAAAILSHSFWQSRFGGDPGVLDGLSK